MVTTGSFLSPFCLSLPCVHWAQVVQSAKWGGRGEEEEATGVGFKMEILVGGKDSSVCK